MSLLRVGLAFPLTIFFSGCIGPLGVRTGWAKGEFETLATRPAQGAKPAERFLRRETEKKALMLFSPEGPRANFPIDSSYDYFIQVGDSAPKEVGFLKMPTTEYFGKEPLRTIFPLGESGQWIGIFPAPFEYPEKPQPIVPGQPHNFHTAEHIVIVFSAEKILRQLKVEAVDRAPRFSVLPDGKSLRFWRNDGWHLMDSHDGSVRPEPSRPPEAAPDRWSVTIPGTGWRIVFDAPPFAELEEELSGGDYSVAANTHKFIPRAFGGISSGKWPDPAGLSMFIRVNLEAKPDLTRDKARLSYSRTSAFQRTTHYDRTESDSTPAGEVAWRDIEYIEAVGGHAIRIQLRIHAPYERWDDAIVRFEKSLRFEAISR